MSTDNQGVKGPQSLRIQGRKISELPLGLGEIAKQQIPGFIQQERKNRVDAIIARYPRVTMPYLESKIRESEQNLKQFAQARTDTIKKMDEYQGHIRNNKGREPEEVEADVTAAAQAFVVEHRDNPDLVNANGIPIPGTVPFQALREKIKALNAERKPWDEQALWNQINNYQGDIERYDVAAKKESDSILEVRQAMLLIQQRDREITKAMSEPIAVE